MLTALTQVSIPVPHRFISKTLVQHYVVLQLQLPLYCIIHSCCTMCTQRHTATHITSLVVNLPYMPLYARLEHYSLLVSPFPEHCGSVCLSLCLGRGWHKRNLGGLISGALRGHHATSCCCILLHYFGNDAFKYMTRKK
jgi:hypothetical protein